MALIPPEQESTSSLPPTRGRRLQAAVALAVSLALLAIAGLLVRQLVLLSEGLSVLVPQDRVPIAEVCSPEEIAVLMEIREDVMIADGWPVEDIPGVFEIGGMARADGSCLMSLGVGSISDRLDVMEETGWTLVHQADGRYTLERGGQRVQLVPLDQGETAAEVLP